MVTKDKQIVSQKFNDLDAAYSYKLQSPISCNELRKLLLHDDTDETYGNLLMKLLSKPSRAKPDEELRLNDDFDEHKDDPDYMRMLGKLKKHGNAYRTEYVEDGSRTIIKYEEASSSDTECDQELIDGPLNQMPLAEVQGILDSHLTSSREEIEKLTCREPRSKSNNEREENAKLLSHSTYAHTPHTPCVRGDSGLDKNCGRQLYRRKLRSYNTKRIDEHVNRAKEMEKLTRTDLQGKSNSGKEENVVVMEPVSRTYSRNCKRNKFKSGKEENVVVMEPVSRTNSRNCKRNKFKSEYDEENVVVMEPVSRTYSRNCKRNKFKSEYDEENVVVMEPVSRTYSRNCKRNKFKSEYDEEKIQFDPEYHLWLQNLKPVEDHHIFTAGDIKVVYELKSGECDRMKEDEDDDYGESSDVEIIDIDTFHKMNNRGTTGQSTFRDKVIAALRKPFDIGEYKKRWREIKFQSLKERHIDLRGGRERPIGTQVAGKCYLDYHPALNKKLSQAKAKSNRPKQLNLLRGFFLWLEQPEEFSPWLDKECLAVRPGSG
ncbi:hypothetical protein AAHA92_03938 [Salvia divinorum]|uniref:Uncharacterized protein n=1 Tax=Salvia divinorum TaxID=28513 RepID=A0ABD1HXK4_SALDI